MRSGTAAAHLGAAPARLDTATSPLSNNEAGRVPAFLRRSARVVVKDAELAQIR